MNFPFDLFDNAIVWTISYYLEIIVFTTIFILVFVV